MTNQAAQFTQEERAAMARAVANLFEKWGVGPDQACRILGDIDRDTYDRLLASMPMDVDDGMARRMSLLLGIHRYLKYLFIEPDRGYAWVSKPNDAFNGTSALEVMATGRQEGLERVHGYLGAQIYG